jgi:hypothetical protein
MPARDMTGLTSVLLSDRLILRVEVDLPQLLDGSAVRKLLFLFPLL